MHKLRMSCWRKNQKDENDENEKLNEILLCVKDIQISIKECESLSQTTVTGNVKLKESEKIGKRLEHLMCRSVQEIISIDLQMDFLFVVCCSEAMLKEAVNIHSSKQKQVPGTFYYDPENGLSFTLNEKILSAFSNLKRHLKYHLMSIGHISNCSKSNIDEENSIRRETKNREIGTRITRLCYSTYKEGKSKLSFEVEVLKRIQDRLDMGDINHSHNFPAKFRPFVAAEIHRRMSLFFNIRMTQTGFLPPINIGADKGTSHHRIRQFIIAVTIIPDADKFIQPVYIGQPVVKQLDGKGIACP